MTLIAQQRYADAVDVLRTAVQQNPGPGAEMYLAIALRGDDKPSEALELLLRVTAGHPVPPQALYELGALHYAQHRLAEAEAALRRGLAAAPNVPDFSLMLGNIALSRGDAAAAEAAFGRVLALAPGHVEALVGLGSALMGRALFAAAAERFEAAATREPAHARAQLLLATCLMELRRRDEAIGRLRGVVSTAPQLLGPALQACTQAGRGRLWLKPSAAAAALRDA
jgi:tetratricopeptide (TPR) repeat protein